MNDNLTLGDYLELAFMIAWLVVAVYLSIMLHVWSPASLAKAPARQSKLSLAAVFSVLVVYFFFTAAVATVAVGLHLYSEEPKVDGPTQTAASRANPALQPVTDSSPAPVASASAPASASVATAKRDRDFAKNCINSAAELLTVIVCMAFVPSVFRDRFKGIGLHKSQLVPGIIGGALGFVVVYPILIVLYWGTDQFLQYLHMIPARHPVLQSLIDAPPMIQRLGYAAGAVLIAPLAEEFIFRGALQSAIAQYKFGLVIPQFTPPSAWPASFVPSNGHRYMAILLSSLAFAALHPPYIQNAPVIFALAMALGYVYERTGSLYAPILIHVIFNSVSIFPLLFGSKS